MNKTANKRTFSQSVARGMFLASSEMNYQRSLENYDWEMTFGKSREIAGKVLAEEGESPYATNLVEPLASAIREMWDESEEPNI